MGPCGEEASDQTVISVHLTSHFVHLTVVQGITKDHSEVGTVAGDAQILPSGLRLSHHMAIVIHECPFPLGKKQEKST